MKSFASDNTAVAHPRILQAMTASSTNYAPPYGGDDWTAQAASRFKEVFGPTADVHFVFNGTAANVLSISSLIKPHHLVLTSDISHLISDECGALERFAGAKPHGLPSKHGKIRPEQIQPWIDRRGDQHHNQARVISLSQTTEYGTVYSVEELRAFSKLAHANDMLLHVDGARFSNAAATLGVSLKALSADAGVDVLSFGATKNGLAFGEAVVFFNRPEESRDFPFVRKQGMNLASKMRYISAQFLEILKDDLWLENARHANAMAQRLEAGLRKIKGLEIICPVQANAVFAKLPEAVIRELQKKFYFYVWDSEQSIVRLMASFQTQAADVDELIAEILIRS